MIVLRRARFISSGRIYRSGDVLPDSAIARSLAEKGFAEVINDTQTAKSAKKSKAETAQQNDTVNS
ncbi:MAG: hypothetical protein IJQ08_04965 [Synergistaceae bacterium]|nr:hypothetical protein [Synergistaceae bacterium]